MGGSAFNGIKGLKFPFVVGTLVCAMILLGWKNAPLLTVYLPPQSRFFGLSPADLFSGSHVIPEPSEMQISRETISQLRNETLDKDDGLANAREDSTFSVKNDSGTGAKDILFGSPVPYLPSQQTTVVPDELPTSVSKETSDKPAGHAEDAAANNGSVRYPTEVSSTGTPPARGDKNSDLGKVGISAPVFKNSSKMSPVGSRKDEGKSTAQTNEQTCNYAIGKWVADERRPFYSGDSCKQWLSGMWACRLTQRLDFSYEKFRWQPYFCDMEDFEGSKFLNRMRDKTLAFIGDSLARQQFQSLLCMITSGQETDDVINVGWEYGLVKAPGAKRPEGWAYRFPTTNTTVLFYWSACLCDLQPINHSDPQTEIAMHLDRPPSFLTRFIQRFDVLVLNTGHHWNPGKITGNKWIMYVNGIPNTDENIKDARFAKKFTIRSIIQWVDSRMKVQSGLKAFLRSMSPRHFFNGDWNTGGSCDNTNPLSRGNQVLKEELSDLECAEAVIGTKVKLLAITALSELRDEGHISKYGVRGITEYQDCLHWCLPGIPDTWNEILIAQL